MIDNSEILEELEKAKNILVIQGENPDGDSLASALALEEILENTEKRITMYCRVDMPKHLRFMDGWDRVVNELPKHFDLSIVVDTASEALLERTFSAKNLPHLRSKPMIVIDHHDIQSSMPFATINYISLEAASTGEAMYKLFTETNYKISLPAKKMIITSIMYDTRGLSTDSVTASTIRLVADFVEAGVSLAELTENRQRMNKRDEDISKYKGQLLQRVEVKPDLGLATVEITWPEIEMYSDRYNPSILVLDEMRLINGVDIAIAYKTYPDGKILAKIRSNRNSNYASTLAESFGGGGHPNAAGFKLSDRPFTQLKSEVESKLKEIRAV